MAGAHAAPLQGAPPEGELRAVIVLARHGVRAPIESETRSGVFNAQPWPAWSVAPGVLTPHGTEALRLLGKYYRVRYASLLDHTDCAHPRIYAEANTTQRTIASAKAMLGGISPGCQVQVQFRPKPPNPLFTPWQGADARGLPVDQQLITDATLGRMGDRPAWFAHAFNRPLEQMHQALAGCSGAGCDASKPDFRTNMLKDGGVVPRDPAVESPVSLGADFAENFLLEYTEGLPLSQVGWGRVSRERLDDLMEMNTRYHDFMLRTPYAAQVAASDLAAHIRDTVTSVVTLTAAPGRLGSAEDRFILLDAHDGNLTWLGGLLRLDWLLPDGTFNATRPGSALVLEVYGRGTSATVRVLFISQTLDQMRNLRPLTLKEPPLVAPVFVPACSGKGPAYACSVNDFAWVVSSATDPRFVEQPAK
jgi:4-phytase/acid phosphatase